MVTLPENINLITTMGKFLDPIADKLIINTAMILMIPIGRIPAWIVAITIIRDLIVDVIRSIASSEGIYIQASLYREAKDFDANHSSNRVNDPLFYFWR